MELKNRTLSNFAELVQTGECKKFRGRLKVGVDLGTANTVLAVVDRNNRPVAGSFRTFPCNPGRRDRKLLRICSACNETQTGA